MKKEKNILLISKWYYKKLQCEVELANLEGISLEQLCDKLGGFNFDGELFDVNYGSICATIIYKNKKFRLSNNIEIWDDENCICLYEEYIVK